MDSHSRVRLAYRLGIAGSFFYIPSGGRGAASLVFDSEFLGDPIAIPTGIALRIEFVLCLTTGPDVNEG